MKTLKEYITGFSNGVNSLAPIASLGDTPPKGAQYKTKRSVGINANKEYDLKDKALYYKLVRQAMSVMPGSQKQKQIKKEIERVQKRLGIKEDKNLYTDENPKGTIHGLGFTDGETARKSVSKIKNSGKTHAHKMQAAIAMSQRAKVASERAKDPEKKKNLGQAHKIYQTYIDTNKKSKD